MPSSDVLEFLNKLPCNPFPPKGSDIKGKGPSTSSPRGKTSWGETLKQGLSCLKWLVMGGAVLGGATLLKPTEVISSDPVPHCTAKVPMKMHPSPAEVKYYGDE
jgi:hypothetical protein